MHKINFWGAPDPTGGAYDAPRTPNRMVRGHLSPRTISRHTEWGGVIGPRDNDFPGPAVALDGPVRIMSYIITRHSSVSQTVVFNTLQSTYEKLCESYLRYEWL